MRITLILSLLLAVTAGFAPPAFAAVDPGKKKIAFTALDLGVRDTLAKLMRQEGLKFRFDASVTNKRKIYIEVGAARRDEILAFILDQNHITVKKDADGTYIFSVRKD